MARLPDQNTRYKEEAYWNERYETEEQFDWFASYSAFRPLVLESVNQADRCLMLGCGNSTLSAEMYQDGFHHIVNTDYSPVVIRTMTHKYKAMQPMTWELMDITKLQYDEASFDIVMEKGTLDAMLVEETDPWNITEESSNIIDTILSQVSKVLKPGGRFISITFAQPHFRKPLYALDKYGWSISLQTFGQGFQYFYYIMTKGEPLSKQDTELVQEYNKRLKQAVTYTDPVSDSDDEDFLLKHMDSDSLCHSDCRENNDLKDKQFTGLKCYDNSNYR